MNTMMMTTDDLVTVAVWPDGTWCLEEEISGMDHMSDDYKIMDVIIDDDGVIAQEYHSKV